MPILYSRVTPERAHRACEITPSVCQPPSWTSCPCTHLMHAAATQPCQPLRLGCGSQGEGRASPPSPLRWYGCASNYSRGFYRFPDKAVQEAKGKSGSPSDSGDTSCYIAEIIFALVPISKHQFPFETFSNLSA